MRAPSPDQARRAPAPWFLIAALGLLVGAGAYAYLRRSAGAPYLPPAAGDPEQPVQVWRGEMTLAAGGRLVAEVAPLHADAGRQAFETASLRRKFARSDGEPWRVRLRREPASDANATADSGADAAAIVELEALTLHDTRGLAAAALELPKLDGALQDPVWSLFRAPQGGLASAQAADLVLWGRAPGDRAELRARSSGAALATPLAIALEAAHVARAQLERPFTHRTRSDEVDLDGKTRASGTSERRPRARSGADG